MAILQRFLQVVPPCLPVRSLSLRTCKWLILCSVSMRLRACIGKWFTMSPHCLEGEYSRALAVFEMIISHLR